MGIAKELLANINDTLQAAQSGSPPSGHASAHKMNPFALACEDEDGSMTMSMSLSAP